MIIAKITPHWFHRWWRKENYEPFRTYYRANSLPRIRGLCMKAGLEVDGVQFSEGCPMYLQGSLPLFFCGVMYERVVNSASFLSVLRHRIILDAHREVCVC